MPSSRTRPNVVTSIVSPSMTARTSTSSDRSRACATSAAEIAITALTDVIQNCIAVSSAKQLREAAARACKAPTTTLLTAPCDDGIVVPMTTDEYLRSYETNRPRELTYGILREPPAPFFSHQQVVFKIARLLADHVERAALGDVAVAPVDVILDAGRSLIVQPDVLFVSNERRAIIRDQVWGAPDLIVEVLSPRTAAHDRTQKLGWYRQYGVRECWLVDPAASRITVFDFTGAAPTFRTFEPPGAVRSPVLTDFTAAAASLLP